MNHPSDCEQPWMGTYSGGKFNFLEPETGDIDLVDIAHGLSLNNRFNGATIFPYSVAQHSMLMTHVVPYEHRRVALLHDAAEAYLPDVHSLLKDQLGGWRELEGRVQRAIFRAFGVDDEEVEACRVTVKEADLRLLATEKKELMRYNPHPWEILQGVEPLPLAIFPIHWKEVKQDFLRKFEEVFGVPQEAAGLLAR